MAEPVERTLDEATIDSDPIRQFQLWLHEASVAGERMPNAMAVATAAADGTPSVRMLLLESVDARGFTFLTSIQSPTRPTSTPPLARPSPSGGRA